MTTKNLKLSKIHYQKKKKKKKKILVNFKKKKKIRRNEMSLLYALRKEHVLSFVACIHQFGDSTFIIYYR